MEYLDIATKASVRLVFDWFVIVFLIALLLYLMFCVTSEITLSPPDLAGMWRGFFPIALFIILLNLIPGMHILAMKLTDVCAPAVFLIHAVLLFVLFIDIVFYIVFSSFLRIFNRR